MGYLLNNEAHKEHLAQIITFELTPTVFFVWPLGSLFVIRYKSSSRSEMGHQRSFRRAASDSVRIMNLLAVVFVALALASQCLAGSTGTNRDVS